jgi:hypothetical protein
VNFGQIQQYSNVAFLPIICWPGTNVKLRMGDYYSDVVLEEARSIGKTLDD